MDILKHVGIGAVIGSGCGFVLNTLLLLVPVSILPSGICDLNSLRGDAAWVMPAFGAVAGAVVGASLGVVFLQSQFSRMSPALYFCYLSLVILVATFTQLFPLLVPPSASELYRFATVLLFFSLVVFLLLLSHGAFSSVDNHAQNLYGISHHTHCVVVRKGYAAYRAKVVKAYNQLAKNVSPDKAFAVAASNLGIPEQDVRRFIVG